MDIRILVLSCGSTYPDIIHKHGDFSDWFQSRFIRPGVTCDVVDVTRPFHVETNPYTGILITGSLASAYQREPWILDLTQWLSKILQTNHPPVLGVCFGHQILAAVSGGHVRRCIDNLEIGTHPVRLTDRGREDYLFRDIPEEFFCQETHVDEVTVLPPGAEILAGNSHSAVQAFSLGENVRGVQFHPEMDDVIMRSVILSLVKKNKLHNEGTEILQNLRPTPFAARVLENFLSHTHTGNED